MKLFRLGEFGLIERIRRYRLGDCRGYRLGDCRRASIAGGSVVLGIGDDAAVIEPSPGYQSLFTTDAMVEGKHFSLKYTPVGDLGWKLLAVNISDIAAMGGLPKAALVTLGLTEWWSVRDVDRLYEGLNRCAEIYGCAIAGGDIVSSDITFLSLALWGEVEKGKWIPRSGARAGDRICVTGTLGSSRAGLEVLSGGRRDRSYGKAVSKFLRPLPRVEEARALAQALPVTSMIDISDGLASELHHLCRESGTGCCVNERDLPVSDEALRWTTEKEIPLPDFILNSGEEYELLFTVEGTSEIRPPFQGVHIPVTVIGIMDSRRGVRLKSERGTIAAAAGGWDHFSRSGA